MWIQAFTEQYVWLPEKVIWTNTCIKKKSKNIKYFHPNAEEDFFKGSDIVICVNNSCLVSSNARG